MNINMNHDVFPRNMCFLLLLLQTSIISCLSQENSGRMCVINGVEADCSNHGSKLWYIPRLPNNITSLKFNYNVLHNVTQHTFLNLTRADIQLQDLQLNGDRIQYISQNAFSVFKQLKHLSLSGNKIHPEILRNAFVGIGKTPIQRLDLIHMGIDTIPKTFFRYLSSSKITHIFLHMNNFLFFNISELNCMNNLVHIGLSQNYLSYVIMHNNDTLKELDIAYNIVRNFCSHSTYVPSLKYLDLNFNSIYQLDRNAFDCLPNLQRLELNGNFIEKLDTDMFSKMTNLVTLHLKVMPALWQIKRYAFNNSNIKYISIRRNTIHSFNIDKDAFAGCNNLENVDLSLNDFKHSSEEFFQNLFDSFYERLVILDISSCLLPRIPYAISKMSKLKYLYLGMNSFYNLDQRIFENLTSLTMLDLHDNSITTVSETTIPSKVRRNLDSVDFSTNPFDCSCSLLWFMKWFRSNQTLFDKSVGSYECASPNKIKLLNMDISEQTCLLGFAARMIIVFGCSVVMTAAVVVAVLYKYRWHLRYIIYMMCMNRGYNTNGHQEFSYDAFILYCADDADWIFDFAVPVLEGQYGIKLCLHERNFVAGKLIIDNIMTCIKQSGKLVVVLSNSFAASEWCHFEMDIIQRELLENRHELPVVIMMEELNTRLITQSMFAIMMSTTYIKWTQHPPEASVLFWKSLVRILQPSQSNVV